MRRILTKEEAEKKSKRNKTILSLLMLGIMVLSTAGFAFIYTPGDNSDSGTPPEGLVNVGNQWGAIVNGQTFYFSSSPDATSAVPVDTTVTLSSYSGKNLFVDSTNQAVTTEILSTLGRFATRAQEACYGACERDLPEKDCTENMVIWKESAERKVYQQENCVFIEGDLTAVDAFLYKAFGFQ